MRGTLFHILTALALLSLGFPKVAWASSSLGEVHEFYNGARMMGMGGTSIAVVNDETALLSNPAGLGKVRDFFGTVVDPEIDLDAKGVTLESQKLFNPFDPAATAKALDGARETYLHARAQLFPSIVVRNFGIGVFARNSMDAYMSADGSTMKTRYFSDYALMLGTNLRMWDGRIKIGVVGKGISRISVDKDLDTTKAMDLKSVAAEGEGVGADVGVTLTAPWVWLPTATAVIRDVGGTSFHIGSGMRMNTTDRPDIVQQDIDLALAVFPIHSLKNRSSFTVEYDKLNEASQAHDKLRYVHVGYELNMSDALFLRAGMNQKYWTAGAELASEHTQLQLASYGEDVGTDQHSVEDRRFIFKFSFRF